MALSYGDIRKLTVKNVAWDPDIMAAVALAESSGDPNVVNSIGCVGLWQINWPAWKGDSHMRFIAHNDPNRLKDPNTNLMAAIYVYERQGYKAWETYTNGSYKKFLQDNGGLIGSQVQNIKDVGGNNVGNIANAIPDAITNAVQGFTKGFVNSALNAGALLTGLVFVVLGIILLARNDVKSAAKTSVKVASILK